MHKHNLLDDLHTPKLRKPIHTVLEWILLIGHLLLGMYCVYETFLAYSIIEEIILILLSSLAIGYIYSWHYFSINYDHNNSKNTVVPVYLNPLRFLSFFISTFFFFIGFLFTNFERYKFDVSWNLAQWITLLFLIVGLLQLVYSLLTPTTKNRIQ